MRANSQCLLFSGTSAVLEMNGSNIVTSAFPACEPFALASVGRNM